MIQFGYFIQRKKMRADGTWPVYIRLRYGSETRLLQTETYVNKDDLSRNGEIKNIEIIKHCVKVIEGYKQIVDDMLLELYPQPIDKIVERLKKGMLGDDYDFVEYAMKWCDDRKSQSGVKNYKTAVNAFCEFMGKEKILTKEITVQVLENFSKSLQEKKRAMSLYPSSIRKLLQDACTDIITNSTEKRMCQDVIDRFHAPLQNVAKKRALTVDQIRSIFSLPYDNKGRRGESRHDLAKDCYMLSFALMGMNSADLFDATDLYKGRITYYRDKTKDRRPDNAEIQIDIPEEVWHLLVKYKGKERVFNFYERFANKEQFNRALNIGLKEIGEQLGIKGLQFYSARHSMATIAVNKVGIDKYTVSSMLNHIDPSMRVTDIYIKNDFNIINKANRQLMTYCFK